MKLPFKLSAKHIWSIVGVAILVLGVYRFQQGKANAKKGSDRSAVTTVLVQKAQPETLQRFLDLYANISAENEVELTSPVTGKVLRYNRIEGQSVSRGQSVLSIDRFEVGARYAAAPVASPVNGVVTRILVSEGADVKVGTPVAMVGNIKRLEAVIQVPESSVSEVKAGQKVYFQSRAFPGKTFEGEITRKDLSIDPNTRALSARAIIPNADGSLFSGVFAESYVFVEEATNSYVIPESALAKTKEGFDAVFVNENNVAKLRKVDIGLRYRDKVAITNGITDGEEIIVFGREYLTDGSPIRALDQTEEVADDKEESQKDSQNKKNDRKTKKDSSDVESSTQQS